MMEVSRHTYGRILTSARSIIAEALVTGKALKIEGGTYELRGKAGGAAEEVAIGTAHSYNLQTAVSYAVSGEYQKTNSNNP